MPKLVAKWREELAKELGNDCSCLASVRQGGFQNASKLVGKKWSLRTSRDLIKGEAINLMSFDPNFRRPEVFCRYKGCSVTNPDPAVLKRFGSGKRDLYLCPNHRDELMRKVNEMCQKKGVILTAKQRDKATSKVMKVLEEENEVARKVNEMCQKKGVILTAEQLDKVTSKVMKMLEENEVTRKVNEMCQKKGVILTAEQRDKMISTVKKVLEEENKVMSAAKTESKEIRQKPEVIPTTEKRRKTESEVKEVRAKPEVVSESEDLSDYIQLTPLLEKIYRETVKARVPPTVAAQEAVLNVRNFLLITNAVLNPDHKNLGVLPPVLMILIMILRDPVISRNLLLLLRGVIQEILFFFGVVYNWVYLDMNPGAMIGAGVGGFAGMIGGAVLGPWGSAVGAAGGVAFGCLIGSGIYRLNNERAHVRRDFEFEGNARGDLNLIIR